MKTYTKTYTRDNSLIMQESWGRAFVGGFEKEIGMKNPFAPININYVNDGVVEIWDCKEAFEWFFNKLLEKNKTDVSFFEEHVKAYELILEELEPFKEKEVLSSLQELKEFIQLIFRGTKHFIIFYHSAIDERTPKEIKEKALKMRDADSYFDDGNRIIRDSLSFLYPRIKGMELVIISSDFDNIPSNEVLEARMKNCVFWAYEDLEIIELKNYLKKHPEYNFVFDKITKETLEKGIIRGFSAVKGKVEGKVRILKRKIQISNLKEGEIIVSHMTTVDFEPAMKKAAAIITDEGGITCHAAIISREMNKPCIIGTKIATKVLKDGDLVEVDAEKGIVRILKKK